MGTIASQITSFTIVYSTVYSDADQEQHQSSPSLAFVRGIHRGPVNSLHKWPVTRKMFPFDDVIMINTYITVAHCFGEFEMQKSLPVPFWCHIYSLFGEREEDNHKSYTQAHSMVRYGKYKLAYRGLHKSRKYEWRTDIFLVHHLSPNTFYSYLVWPSPYISWGPLSIGR